MSRAVETVRRMLAEQFAMQFAERILGAHAPHLAESAREHLRYTCRAVGSDPDAAEARAQEAWKAETARAQTSAFPARGSLAEAYDEERLRVCRGGGER